MEDARAEKAISLLSSYSAFSAMLGDYMSSRPRNNSIIVSKGSNKNVAKLKSKRKQAKKSKQVNRR